MPYIKLPNFKLGINPSLASDFDMKNLTGTQKVLLASARIFGYAIGGNMSSGAKIMRKKMRVYKNIYDYEIPFNDIRMDLPIL